MIKELLIVTLELKSLIGWVSPNRLVVHPMDSDIGSDPDTRKSTSEKYSFAEHDKFFMYTW